MQKTVEDQDSKSLGMPMEGGEDTELVAHDGSFVEDEAQRAESSQNAMEPSSTSMITNMGT